MYLFLLYFIEQIKETCTKKTAKANNIFANLQYVGQENFVVL